MVRRVMTVLCVGAIFTVLASCGQTYKLQSISVSPTSASLATFGSTQQLTVTATYTNTKTADVTQKSQYSIGGSSAPNNTAPLSVNGLPTVTVNNSGLVAASPNVPACTYAPTTNVPYPYSVNVTYTENGVTVSTSASLNVATASGCDVTSS
jgi:hypothetical protein